jgi:hypothetical protein
MEKVLDSREGVEAGTSIMASHITIGATISIAIHVAIRMAISMAIQMAIHIGPILIVVVVRRHRVAVSNIKLAI